MDTPQVKVVAIGYDTLQGQAIKYWDLEDNEDSITTHLGNWFGCSSARCMGGRMYERIGIKDLYFTSLPNTCNGGVIDPFLYTLRCYEDDSVSVNFTNKACEYWSWIGIEELVLEEKFIIYPNPNTLGLLNIESWNAFDEITIVSVSGQVILSEKVSTSLKTSVNVELEKGLYFVHLKSAGRLIGNQKLVVQ